MNTNKIDSLMDIPKLTYSGYLWQSDKQSPAVFKNQTVDFSQYINQENPFIIEGLLWAENEEVSIQIKHTHRYLINRICLKDISTEHELIEKKYHTHRIKGVKHLKFKQLWIPEPDPLCEGMEVLTIKALIFVGFE
ncbi:MAG: TIGR04423 family type III CRISPR-associated protein [Spirosomataceae bacterium]